jgi:hypothetical protein
MNAEVSVPARIISIGLDPRMTKSKGYPVLRTSLVDSNGVSLPSSRDFLSDTLISKGPNEGMTMAVATRARYRTILGLAKDAPITAKALNAGLRGRDVEAKIVRDFSWEDSNGETVTADVCNGIRFSAIDTESEEAL